MGSTRLWVNIPTAITALAFVVIGFLTIVDSCRNPLMGDVNQTKICRAVSGSTPPKLTLTPYKPWSPPARSDSRQVFLQGRGEYGTQRAIGEACGHLSSPGLEINCLTGYLTGAAISSFEDTKGFQAVIKLASENIERDTALMDTLLHHAIGIAIFELNLHPSSFEDQFSSELQMAAVVEAWASNRFLITGFNSIFLACSVWPPESALRQACHFGIGRGLFLEPYELALLTSFTPHVVAGLRFYEALMGGYADALNTDTLVAPFEPVTMARIIQYLWRNPDAAKTGDAKLREAINCLRRHHVSQCIQAPRLE